MIYEHAGLPPACTSFLSFACAPLGGGFSCHAALDAASWAALCGVLHRRAVSTTGDAARKVSTMCRLCGEPRPDVAVRWIARSRIIRRPAGQRWARSKFILSEAGGKFMNFSVRRAGMSGCRRIRRRHSFLPFFCCRKKGSTSVARKPFVAAATLGAAARKVSTMRLCAENPARTLQSVG